MHNSWAVATLAKVYSSCCTGLAMHGRGGVCSFTISVSGHREEFFPTAGQPEEVSRLGRAAFLLYAVLGPVAPRALGSRTGEVWEGEQSSGFPWAILGPYVPGGAEHHALAFQLGYQGVVPAPKDRRDPISGAALPLPHWLCSLMVFSLGEVVWFCLSQIAVLGR